MRVRRDRIVAAMVAGATVLGFSSAAWACYIDYHAVGAPGYLSAPQPRQGTPGTQVSVGGENWQPNEAMQVAWSADGVAFSTPALAVTPSRTTGSFVVRLSVPNAEAGVWYVLAAQGESRAATPFRVLAVGAAEEETTNQPATVGGPASGSASGAPSSEAADSGTATNTRPAASGTGGIPSAPGQPGAAVEPVEATAPASSASPSSPTPLAGSDRQPTAATPSGLGSVGLAGAVERGAASETPVAAAAGALAPSAAGESLWAGFGAGPAPLARGLADLPQPSSGSGSLTGALAGVVALVAMFAGFAFAEVRRRRVSIAG